MLHGDLWNPEIRVGLLARATAESVAALEQEVQRGQTLRNGY